MSSMGNLARMCALIASTFVFSAWPSATSGWFVTTISWKPAARSPASASGTPGRIWSSSSANGAVALPFLMTRPFRTPSRSRKTALFKDSGYDRKLPFQELGCKKERRHEAAELVERLRGVDGSSQVRAVVEALGVPGAESTELVDHPAMVRSGVCRADRLGLGHMAEARRLMNPLVHQQLDVLEEELTAV